MTDTTQQDHKEQVLFFDWLDFEATKHWPKHAIVDSWEFEATKDRPKRPRYRLPAFAVPKGGHRSINDAVRLKAGGVRSGVLGIQIPIPKEASPGLWIEMKSKELSPAQKEWRRVFESLGYVVRVCKNKDEAVKAVTEYLRGC